MAHPAVWIVLRQREGFTLVTADGSDCACQRSGKIQIYSGRCAEAAATLAWSRNSK